MPKPPVARRRSTVSPGLTLTLLLATVAAAGPPPAPEPAAAPLTVEERTEGHLALERVKAEHRVRPEQPAVGKAQFDRQAQGPFDRQAVQRAAARAADESLRMSDALARRYGVTFSGDELQAELDRMGRTSLDPERLAEYFAALAHEPRLAAECLARPVLAENALRDRFAWDDGIHARVRAEAEEAWSAATLETLRGLGGRYSESEWVRVGDPSSVAGADAEPIDGPTYLDDDGWARLQARLRRDLGLGAGTELPRAGSVGRLQETAERLIGTALLAATPERVRLARVAWPKQEFHAWWARQRTRFGTAIVEPAYDYRLPAPGAARAKAAAGGDWWKPISGSGAPSVRSGHEAVWTGSEMVVWGGWAGDNADHFQTGGVYDPATNSWSATTTVGAPLGRRDFAAFGSSGRQMVVWGGYGGANFDTGAIYDLGDDDWTDTCSTVPAPCNVPDARRGHTMVAAGRGLGWFTVWGGVNSGGALDSGGTYEYYGLGDGAWLDTDTADPHQPSARYDHTAVLVDTALRARMMVWGGHDRLATGAMLALDDLDTDLWLPVSTSGTPPGRERHAGVSVLMDEVTHDYEVVVWGGYTWGTDLWSNQGGSYHPHFDRWTLLSTDGAPAGRQNLRMAWTGPEVVLWGGDQTSTVTRTGGRYDPVADTWSLTDTSDADTPSARTGHAAVWTGKGLIVWGGYDLVDRLDDGAMYLSCFADPSGYLYVHAHDADGCASSGIAVAWPQDPVGDWGDYGNSSRREYMVLRNGVPITFGGCAGPIAYGTTGCTDELVPADTPVEYSVVYSNACGGALITPDPATATDLSGSEPEVTAACTVLDADPCVSGSGIQVSWPASPGGDWGDNFSGPRQYRVWRWDAVTGWQALGDRLSTNVYTDLTAVAGTDYRYKVRYINGCSLSTDTAQSALVRDGAGVDPVVSHAAVVADADACDTTGIRVSWPRDADSWGDGDSPNRLYRVRRSTDGVSFEPIGTNLAYGTTSYVDTQAVGGPTCHYQVRYKNACGLAADSGADAAADLPTSPSSPAANSTARDLDVCAYSGVRVAWEADPAAGWGDTGDAGGHTYEVLRDGAVVQTGIPYGTTEIVDGTAAPGTTYLYTVRYLNCGGLFVETSGAAAADDGIPGGVFCDGFETGDTAGWS